MEALLSPLRRALLDPITDVQRRTIALLLDYDTTLTEVSAQLEKTRAAADAAADGIDLLHGDSTRTIEHLAALQEDHTRVSEKMAGFVATSERTIEHLAALQEDHTRVSEKMAKIAVETEEYSAELKRIDELWADLHRDMTALAEAFSRLESD